MIADVKPDRTLTSCHRPDWMLFSWCRSDIKQSLKEKQTRTKEGNSVQWHNKTASLWRRYRRALCSSPWQHTHGHDCQVQCMSGWTTGSGLTAHDNFEDNKVNNCFIIKSAYMTFLCSWRFDPRHSSSYSVWTHQSCVVVSGWHPVCNITQRNHCYLIKPIDTKTFPVVVFTPTTEDSKEQNIQKSDSLELSLTFESRLFSFCACLWKSAAWMFSLPNCHKNVKGCVKLQWKSTGRWKMIKPYKTQRRSPN